MGELVTPDGRWRVRPTVLRRGDGPGGTFHGYDVKGPGMNRRRLMSLTELRAAMGEQFALLYDPGE